MLSWLLYVHVFLSQTLSKTLNRPVLQMQNVGGVIPPAHSAQPLQSFLPAAAGLPQGKFC